MKVKIIKKKICSAFKCFSGGGLIYLSERVSVMSNTEINIRKCTLIFELIHLKHTMDYIQACIFNLRDLIIEIKGI